eukprot:2990824-Prymnesium_polylepis.1
MKPTRTALRRWRRRLRCLRREYAWRRGPVAPASAASAAAPRPRCRWRSARRSRCRQCRRTAPWSRLDLPPR